MKNYSTFDFPEGGMIRTEIACTALGKNGEMRVTAIKIGDGGKDLGYIRMQPITSRGDVGQCWIDIRRTPGTLRKIAALFLSIAEELDEQKATPAT